MLQHTSDGTAYGIQVNLMSGHFNWCDAYALSIEEKELLRLEAGFVQHWLGSVEEVGLDEFYKGVEEAAQNIKKCGPSLLQKTPQVKRNLDALRDNSEFLHLLRNGFSKPIPSKKTRFEEMVTFIKLRFGPAYALLIICIFGIGGRYGNVGARLTNHQLAHIVYRIGRDIRLGQYSLYCPELKTYWDREIGDGIGKIKADAPLSGDPQEISTERSSRNWHATVMNEVAYRPIDVGSLTWSSTRRQLLVLVHIMGRNGIREDLLRRGLLPQYRWGRNGNPTIAPRTDMMEFAELFASDDTFTQELHRCVNGRLVRVHTLEDGAQRYKLTDGLESSLPHHLPQLWVDLFAFTAYIYPRDDALERSFRATGKLLMPVMDVLWECLREGDLPDLPETVRESFIEASLAACRLTNATHAKSIVSTARRLQSPVVSPYLAAMLSWQESVSFRSEGNHNKSDTVLDKILCQIPEVPKTDPDPDIRLHCAYGRLVFSRVENAIMRNDFHRTWGYVDCWERRSSYPSTLEWKLIRLFNTIFGRLAKYTGQFSYARRCFENCLRDDDPSYRHIQYHLADIYCELGCAEQAKDLLRNDVEQLRHMQGQKSKAFRRLALPLAEAHINLRQLNAARYTLEEVLQAHESMQNHDVTDQLGHVRTLISLARVDWYERMYSSADQKLNRATVLVENYPTFIKRGFDVAFVNLFHSVVKRALAGELLSEVPRGYFMAGTGTYFFEEIFSNAWTGISRHSTELSSVSFSAENA
ncbi:tetratricopeptide repeat protein [Aspergillus affinis]|uniref:tetratricopeptide repeat protein n=1 Tax=Aspergillus affinis TaxID=1070780 RepID=UPI0022FE93CE|nr:uncharacterized protein KD926_004678 [Aspergillus affinis]KAI9035053.1 hypothetical protein KD926_004678 [Aspergillus affinis]